MEIEINCFKVLYGKLSLEY